VKGVKIILEYVDAAINNKLNMNKIKMNNGEW
jgi:hypothetical protein